MTQRKTKINICYSSHDTPFTLVVLSAYGVDGVFTGGDVLDRWLWVPEESQLKGVRKS